jgi:hypothetical protein
LVEVSYGGEGSVPLARRPAGSCVKIISYISTTVTWVVTSVDSARYQDLCALSR